MARKMRTGFLPFCQRTRSRRGPNGRIRTRAKVNVSKTLQKEVTILRNYRLEAVEQGIARISLKTNVLTPVVDPQLLVQLIQRRFKGEIFLDVVAGKVISRQFTSDNTEIGWAGADSTLHATSLRSEQIQSTSQAVTPAALDQKVSVRETTSR